jgi:hypothetical protein
MDWLLSSAKVKYRNMKWLRCEEGVSCIWRKKIVLSGGKRQFYLDEKMVYLEEGDGVTGGGDGFIWRKETVLQYWTKKMVYLEKGDDYL